MLPGKWFSLLVALASVCVVHAVHARATTTRPGTGTTGAVTRDRVTAGRIRGVAALPTPTTAANAQSGKPVAANGAKPPQRPPQRIMQQQQRRHTASALHAQAVREHHAPLHATPIVDRVRRQMRVRRQRVRVARQAVRDALRAPIGLTEQEEVTCQRDFSSWMHTHKRVYRDADDMTRRYEQYRANWKYISDWNARKDKGGADAAAFAHLTFRLGPNQFCDHSAEEFAKRLGYRPANFARTQMQSQSNATPTASVAAASKPAETIAGTGIGKPDTVDAAKSQRFQSVEHAHLRTHARSNSHAQVQARQFPASKNWADDTSVIGPVRMQGVCGSCWSLAAATVVESTNAILTGEFVSASAQHLLDCCSGADWWPNEGCNGGNMMTAYRYAQQYGVCAWDEYPYTGVAGTCKTCQPVSWISDHTLVTANGDESPIETAIASGGPVVVAITSNIPTFQFYSSGVYNDVACPTTFDTLDHAVVLTGFGVMPPGAATGSVEQPYWWLRNTWDITWGEAGYMRLQRGTNLCGVASEVTQPIAARSSDATANAFRQQMAQRARDATASAAAASVSASVDTPTPATLIDAASVSDATATN